ncbi:MAG: SDR family oxidoreductase [Pseudomonadota bacterium]
MTENKVVLITGASRGIGAETAKAFLAKDYLVVTAQRSPSTIDNAIDIPVDLNDLEVCEALIQKVVSQWGRLDILVNNAGLMKESSVEHCSLELWEETLRLNLTVPFLLSKFAIPYLKKHNGCIVNIGSVEGIGSNPNHAAYCASKAGLHALTRATAVDHGREIRCNAVAPGWIETELNANLVDSMSNPASFKERLEDIHPLGRAGSPSEVAALVVYLASEEASFITGQTLIADGGRTVKLSLPSN